MYIYDIWKKVIDEAIFRTEIEMQREQTCGHSEGRRQWDKLTE